VTAQLAVAGLPSGAAYALIGVVLVLLARTAGVLNVAQTAIGAFGTYVLLEAVSRDLPYALALMAGVLGGAAVGGLAGLVMATWFADHTLMIRSVVAIAFTVALMAIGGFLFGGTTIVVPPLFPGRTVELLGVDITYSALVVVASAVLLAAVTSVVLRSTGLGLVLRAVAERAITSELLGVRMRPLVAAMWAVTGGIAAYAVCLVAATVPSDFPSLTLLVVPALAAALIGRLRSVWLTVAGGLLIGIVQSLLISVPAVADYRLVLPLFVIAAALLWYQRREVWDDVA
jgi:branched-chain amino acid transport system permease protein